MKLKKGDVVMIIKNNLYEGDFTGKVGIITRVVDADICGVYTVKIPQEQDLNWYEEELMLLNKIPKDNTKDFVKLLSL